MANGKSLLGKVKELKREHYECEDRWYSCPKSGNCANDMIQGEECDCGADTDNAKIDEIMRIIQEELGDRNE